MGTQAGALPPAALSVVLAVKAVLSSSPSLALAPMHVGREPCACWEQQPPPRQPPRRGQPLLILGDLLQGPPG